MFRSLVGISRRAQLGSTLAPPLSVGCQERCRLEPAPQQEMPEDDNPIVHSCLLLRLEHR